MYLKRMLFGTAGVVLFFCGSLTVAAQESETETQMNSEVTSGQLQAESEVPEEGIEMNLDDGSDYFLLWSGEGDAAECQKIFLLNADTNRLEEITDQYVKFDKIPVTQSGHYFIFGLNHGRVEDLMQDMLYEVHDPIRQNGSD